MRGRRADGHIDLSDAALLEINEKQARSIKYQPTITKLPLAKDLEDFQFEGTPINQTLVNDLAGAFKRDQCSQSRGLQPQPEVPATLGDDEPCRQ